MLWRENRDRGAFDGYTSAHKLRPTSAAPTQNATNMTVSETVNEMRTISVEVD